MKRDLELVRKILIAIEREDIGDGRFLTREQLGFVEIDDPFFSRHLLWLMEAKLTEGFKMGSDDGIEIMPSRLTWMGCEFLDNIRSDSTWEKVKGIVAEKVVSASMEIIVGLCRTAVMKLLAG